MISKILGVPTGRFNEKSSGFLPLLFKFYQKRNEAPTNNEDASIAKIIKYTMILRAFLLDKIIPP